MENSNAQHEVFCRYCKYHFWDLGADICTLPIYEIVDTKKPKHTLMLPRLCASVNKNHVCHDYYPSKWVRFWKRFGFYRQA